MMGYASYFVAYLLKHVHNRENIARIVLFGSAARSEATKESDIDLFIEVKKKNAKFEREVNEIKNRFYGSREAALFKVEGVGNIFSIKIGKLKEWKDLYRSIASSGIVLFGPYEAREMPSGSKHFAIIYWDSIGINRGALLNKLYGFSVGKKEYEGFIKKVGGRKIGKSCILVPATAKEDVLNLLKKHKGAAHIIEVFV